LKNNKPGSFAALCAFLLCAPVWAQNDAALEGVLTDLDNAATKFHTAEASFVWDQYQKVVDETDSQKGKVYLRRSGKDLQMMAEITDPDRKYVLLNEGKIQIYQPRIDQVTVYTPGNREEVESFMTLGFGGSGHALLKSFDVKYLGKEELGGTQTAKLDLVPKSQKVRNNVAHIILWIDTGRGVSLQQQVFELSGDYRLAKYSDIEINQKLPDNAFKLKTTGKTKTVSTHG
jgi:outer membrane lipoprotein-sorting protein